jgi:hypothetical protein
MKKHLILLIMLTIIIFPLSAQKTKDALYLKNGSIIYGKLINISDGRYGIQTSDGSFYNYATDEVDKFVREAPRFEGRRVGGAGFALEAGLLVGSQNSEFNAPFSFNILVNYTTGTKNIFGIGSGVEFLGSAFSPVFFEYKRLFTERKTTPFIFFRGGAIIHTGGDDESDPYNQYYYPKDYKGGASLGIGTGVSWAKEDGETYLSFAYRYAQTSYKQNSYNDIMYTYKINFNRLEVKLGFKF